MFGSAKSLDKRDLSRGSASVNSSRGRRNGNFRPMTINFIDTRPQPEVRDAAT
jgi:hypothetical protein